MRRILINDVHVNELLVQGGIVKGETPDAVASTLAKKAVEAGKDYDIGSIRCSVEMAYRGGYLRPLNQVQWARLNGLAVPVGNTRNMIAGWQGSNKPGRVNHLRQLAIRRALPKDQLSFRDIGRMVRGVAPVRVHL
jgi:hypothetical protein